MNQRIYDQEQNEHVKKFYYAGNELFWTTTIKFYDSNSKLIRYYELGHDGEIKGNYTLRYNANETVKTNELSTQIPKEQSRVFRFRDKYGNVIKEYTNSSKHPHLWKIRFYDIKYKK